MTTKSPDSPESKRQKLDESILTSTHSVNAPDETAGSSSSTLFTPASAFENYLIDKRREAAKSPLEFPFNKGRIRMISRRDEFPEKVRGIVYWMSRDERVQDNWAFIYAQRMALKYKARLFVCFCLVPKFVDAAFRAYAFILKGLQEVEKECRSLNIPFHLLLGESKTCLPKFVESHQVDGIVCDFFPLRGPLQWLHGLRDALPENVPLCQVDAHNVVPVWVTSDKMEYAARTIRSRIWKHVPQYLTQFPPIVHHPHNDAFAWKNCKVTNWTAAFDSLEVDTSVGEVDWAVPGTTAGLKVLDEFCHKRLRNYSSHRNDPNKEALSQLSPWFHFGQISAQRAILTVMEQKNKPGFKESVDAFVEEAMIRRELSDNFCFYNKDYDNLAGAWEWARNTLNAHRKDKRPQLYTKKQLEDAETYDALWNASQVQLVQEGKMHGFLRMYWAKKILEWTASPEEALEIAIYLNDRYSLDGRDPNGYVGCMWSICGVHDQGWPERAVFGKIRYMNYQGCKKKFDVNTFETKFRKKKKIVDKSSV